MTLQLLHSESPYMRGKFDFLFNSEGLKQTNSCRKFLYRVTFKTLNIFGLSSISYIFFVYRHISLEDTADPVSRIPSSFFSTQEDKEKLGILPPLPPSPLPPPSKTALLMLIKTLSEPPF
jgi:hypothetical protein